MTATSSRSSSVTPGRPGLFRNPCCSWATHGPISGRPSRSSGSSTAPGDIPPLLVVAVGYRVTTLEDNFPLRTRDFTPVVDARERSDRQRRDGWCEPVPRLLQRPAQTVGSGDLPRRHRRRGFVRVLARRPVRDLRAAQRARHVPALRHREPLALLGRRPDVRARSCVRPGARATSGRRSISPSAPTRTATAITAGSSSWRRIAERSRNRRSISEAPYDLVADTRRMVTALRGRAYPSLDLDSRSSPASTTTQRRPGPCHGPSDICSTLHADVPGGRPRRRLRRNAFDGIWMYRRLGCSRPSIDESHLS